VTPRRRSALRRAENPARVLDWEPNHDPASRRFAAVELVEDEPEHDVRWAPTRVLPLDQGREGSCVGHAVAGVIGTAPIASSRISSTFAVQVYKLAQRWDEWPGDHYSGTSVNAGMKVGRSLGWWGGYRWAFGVDDMRRAIRLGPLLLGVPWHAGMYETDDEGVVVVRGQQVGGHALAVVGWSPDYAGRGPGFWWLNSWGRDYGNGGAAFVPEATMRTLVEGVGECAVPVEVGKGRLPDERAA
jgi:hypothetical protein